MNTGKRKFASNLMAIIWFIIYLIPIMTFGFYSLGNIGADKVYKDDIFAVNYPSVSVVAGDVLSTSPMINPNFVDVTGLADIQMIDYIGYDLFDVLLNQNGPGSYPFITIDGVSYYYLLDLLPGSSIGFYIYLSSSTEPFEDIYSSVPFFQVTVVQVDGTYSVDVSYGQSLEFIGTVDYVLPNLFFTVPISSPSFMDKTFAQFGYDSNNLDIVGQSIVDFGELVNFNGLTATSPATFFIWWFFLVTIVRLLFECVAFLPKLAVKWLHYFSRE